MAKTKFPADRLRYFLQEEKIATLEELKRTLGTTGTMTVFRTTLARCENRLRTTASLSSA